MTFPPSGPTFKLAMAPTTYRFFVVHSRSTDTFGYPPTVSMGKRSIILFTRGLAEQSGRIPHARTTQSTTTVVPDEEEEDDDDEFGPRDIRSPPSSPSEPTYSISAPCTISSVPPFLHLRRSSMYIGGTLPPPSPSAANRASRTPVGGRSRTRDRSPDACRTSIRAGRSAARPTVGGSTGSPACPVGGSAAPPVRPLGRPPRPIPTCDGIRVSRS